MKRRTWYFVIAVLAVIAGCTNSDLHSGDRVLVAKFLYETKLQEPHRFDVVVFKYPGKPTNGGIKEGPIDKNVPKNYIKRLLGLPGEILAIFFGRLFHMPAPEPGAPPFIDDVTDSGINPLDLWKNPHTNDAKARQWFNEGRFKIIRKTPDVMLAMRRIVYDNDFPAKDLVGERWKRWKASESDIGWSEDKSNGFIHSGVGKDNVEWLRYRHVLRPDPGTPPAGFKPKPQLITDFLDYNSFTHDSRSFNWVGDLMVECKVEIAKAEGEFRMRLAKGINRFEARFELASGKCTLVQLQDGQKEKVLAEQTTRVKTPGAYHLRFANIDARLTVWVDRDLPFGDGHDYPPPEIPSQEQRTALAEKKLDDAALHTALLARRGPTANDLEPAGFGSQGAAVQLHNLRLWRDCYYTTDSMSATDLTEADLNPWSNGKPDDPTSWIEVKKLNFKTMYVQPGHYLCLGDNSQASSDSRDWGLVPERLMLGRALLIYFPFQRAGAIR